MKITGSATLDAPVETVFAALNDPAVLARTIPGCERLEDRSARAVPDDGHGRGRLDQGHLRRRGGAGRPAAARPRSRCAPPAPAVPARSADVAVRLLDEPATGHRLALRRRRRRRRHDRWRRAADAHRSRAQDGRGVLRRRRRRAARRRGSGRRTRWGSRPAGARASGRSGGTGRRGSRAGLQRAATRGRDRWAALVAPFWPGSGGGILALTGAVVGFRLARRRWR